MPSSIARRTVDMLEQLMLPVYVASRTPMPASRNLEWLLRVFGYVPPSIKVRDSVQVKLAR